MPDPDPLIVPARGRETIPSYQSRAESLRAFWGDPGPRTKPEGDVTVLLVEDDDIDAMLVFEALERNDRVGTIIRASDGDEAFFLLAHGLEPDIALVDLNMPILDGLALLRKCQAEGHDGFPFVVLTTSRISEDAFRSYRRGACLAITKPSRAEHYDDVVTQALAQLWCGVGTGSADGMPARPRFMNVESGRGAARHGAGDEDGQAGSGEA